VSRVVYLPPRPKPQNVRSSPARLWSRLRRVAVPWRSAAAAEDKSRSIYPLTAGGATRAGGPPRAGTLRIGSRGSVGQSIIEVSGELVLRTRDPLAAAVEEALEDDCEEILLDLSGLVAIDHAGLETILVSHLRASDERKPLLIVPGPPAVQCVLEAVQGPFSFAARAGNQLPARPRSRGRRAALRSSGPAHGDARSDRVPRA
jgi:anti-anti-sigma regulatory factor